MKYIHTYKCGIFSGNKTWQLLASLNCPLTTSLRHWVVIKNMRYLINCTCLIRVQIFPSFWIQIFIVTRIRTRLIIFVLERWKFFFTICNEFYERLAFQNCNFISTTVIKIFWKAGTHWDLRGGGTQFSNNKFCLAKFTNCLPFSLVLPNVEGPRLLLLLLFCSVSALKSSITIIWYSLFL